MDKSFLEKRIENKARKEFEKEWNGFVEQIYRHPIFKHITIKIDGEDIPLATFGVNFGVFNQEQDKNPRNKFLKFRRCQRKSCSKENRRRNRRIVV